MNTQGAHEERDTDNRPSADRLVRVLAGRWTLVVLTKLSTRGCRYQDLHDRVEGISHKVLTDTLRRAGPLLDGFLALMSGVPYDNEGIPMSEMFFMMVWLSLTTGIPPTKPTIR